MQQNNHNQHGIFSFIKTRAIKLTMVFLLVITACSENNKPANILEEQKMVSIMTDLHIMDGYMSSLMYNDSVRIKGKNFYATIYDKHKVTPAEYEKSLKYYSMNPVLLDSMYSKVELILAAKEHKLNKELISKPNKPLKE
ncbi:DUF4296 domain-containing protein [Daejeonella sp. H1SJ63]|jgi:hypothetical protein|uniref:DUF4296 domain-containing protein n=1 Tax=Daejeonella sp. H1SJ63 TaxID=3034145 RepID=UPI0023ECC299|nr:DUF4296 domain-containing protein [Daejeonella sp. H1SJ63]